MAKALVYHGGLIEKCGKAPFYIVELHGEDWCHKADEVIANLEAGRHSYIAPNGDGSKLLTVGMAKTGQKFIKLQNDDDEPTRLKSLPLNWTYRVSFWP